MKRNLLLVASLFIGATTYAQFTQDNSPEIGDGLTLYVIDSMAPSYENETGANANWDYSGELGYNDESRNVTVLDASQAPNATSFPNAVEAVDVEGFLQTFSSTTATELTGHGFVFNEPSFGEIVAKFDVDDAKLYEYPMDENSPAIYDDFEGELQFTLGMPMNSPLTGSLVAQVDGKGTLTLADNSYSDVLRYKLVDTILTNVATLGDIEIVRHQYEYYDHSQSDLPIFIHASLYVGQQGGVPLSQNTLVMSLEDPAAFVGLAENELEKTAIYPVPANNELNIELPSTVEKAKITITDVQGRTVYSTTSNQGIKTIDVSNMNKGMYIVNISNEETAITKNIVIQ